MRYENGNLILSVVDSISEACIAFSKVDNDNIETIIDILEGNLKVQIANNDWWFRWEQSTYTQDDPSVIETLENIIEFTNDHPTGAHFLNRYYTCVGNFDEAQKWSVLS